MGKPSFLEMGRADVAEEVSYRAEEMGIHYRTLFPTHFEREPLRVSGDCHLMAIMGLGRCLGIRSTICFKAAMIRMRICLFSVVMMW